jgi:4-azaleucine resistance transporter AzlC
VGNRDAIQAGARAALPVAVAAAAFGASFGVLARTAGISPVAAVAMSATTFAGAAQFAAVSVLSLGGGALAAVAASALLNARYTPMGIAIAPSFRGGVLRRLLTAQLIVDESWALAIRAPEPGRLGTLLGAGLVLWPAWVGGTVLGAFAGEVIGNPEQIGLDAAFPALFLALLVPLVRDRQALAAALLGGGIALLLLPFTAPGVPILASAAACLVGLRR